MSNDKKKALLNEATTKRFWKLAGLRPIHEKAFMFGEEEELEEGGVRGKKEDKEEVDETRGKSNPVGGTLPSGKKGFGPVYTHEPKDDDEYAPKTVKVGNKGSTMTTAKPRKMNEEDLEEDMEVAEMGMPPAAEDDMGAEDPMPEEPGMEDEGPEDGQDVEVDVPEGDVASLRTARDILDQILSAVDGGEEPEMDAEEPALDAEEPELEDEDPEALEEGDEEDLNEIDQEELEEVAERIASRVAKRIAESLKRK